MTIKQWLKTYGWQIECGSKVCGVMSANINFINSEVIRMKCNLMSGHTIKMN